MLSSEMERRKEERFVEEILISPAQAYFSCWIMGKTYKGSDGCVQIKLSPWSEVVKNQQPKKKKGFPSTPLKKYFTLVEHFYILAQISGSAVKKVSRPALQ